MFDARNQRDRFYSFRFIQLLTLHSFPWIMWNLFAVYLSLRALAFNVCVCLSSLVVQTTQISLDSMRINNNNLHWNFELAIIVLKK